VISSRLSAASRYLICRPEPRAPGGGRPLWRDTARCGHCSSSGRAAARRPERGLSYQQWRIPPREHPGSGRLSPAHRSTGRSPRRAHELARGAPRRPWRHVTTAAVLDELSSHGFNSADFRWLDRCTCPTHHFGDGGAAALHLDDVVVRVGCRAPPHSSGLVPCAITSV
jgi:hypothetical protein